jgi:bifunctional DNA-binding transcriptional regulator/antitoxin component of YhaV-PrlF toxin-antitoxin module
MSKVTSKLQLTVPKVIADQYGIRPGDELQWVPAGETIRVVLSGKMPTAKEDLPVKDRLELFDRATQRQRQRESILRKENGPRSTLATDRGWTREEIYTRDFSR